VSYGADCAVVVWGWSSQNGVCPPSKLEPMDEIIKIVNEHETQNNKNPNLYAFKIG